MSEYTIPKPGRDHFDETLWLMPAGKPPKLRFRPGTFVRFEGQLLEIFCAYRIADNPQEWHFRCEYRQDLESTGISSDPKPRIVYEIFRDSHDAYSYFADIPRMGDSRVLSNRQLCQAEIVSSGQVLAARSRAVQEIEG